MKVRIIEGFYRAPKAPADRYLKAVTFPMEVEPSPEALKRDPGLTTSTIEHAAALTSWAREKFAAYDIFEVEVPDPLVHAVVLDRTGTGGHELDFVGAFYDYAQADEAAQETSRRAFGDPVALHFAPFRTFDEWREDAESQGVIGDDDRETGT